MDRDDFKMTTGGSDDYRPLTLDGIEKMQKNAKGLRSLVKRPDFLISSSLTRAQQTSEILQSVWTGLDVITIDQLRPTAKVQALADSLNALVKPEMTSPTFVIVGHEPHLTKAVTWFLRGPQGRPLVELKKGGACLLEFPESFAKASATLKWLATPRMLR